MPPTLTLSDGKDSPDKLLVMETLPSNWAIIIAPLGSTSSVGAFSWEYKVKKENKRLSNNIFFIT